MALDCLGLPDVAGLPQQARVDGPAVDSSTCSGDGKGRIGRTVITVKQANHRAPEERTPNAIGYAPSNLTSGHRSPMRPSAQGERSPHILGVETSGAAKEVSR